MKSIKLETQTQLQTQTDIYKPLPSVYDELIDESGNIRTRYNYLFESFKALGWEEIQQRTRDAERILQENGVTYNIYSDDTSRERQWKIDLFPVLLESEEWRKIERGLDQRGELLNSILKDIYGQRRLIKEKRIPPELIWACPGFLRACDGMLQKAGLCFFATDLIRNRNGDFVVLSDKIQAPSGSGYSLENRIVMSRIFPSIYRDSQVHRIAGYFRALRKNLQQFSGVEGRDPVICLLTPGPGNETYFEHSYLASYLGYTLVQGSDLTVRNNILYMKTVEGLQRVDLILKRVDDSYMDALELKGDSLLGVPGVLEAVRSGNVKIANPVGGGILENRGLMAFLPDLCRFYLGEELILPIVTTYWLGKEEDYSYVMREKEAFIYKPVFPSIQDQSFVPSKLTGEELDQLWEKIRRNPNLWIAQEIVEPSTVPILNTNGFQPGRAIYRTFVTMSSSGYQVMSGGLVRVTRNINEIFITNQRGAFSKDLWILSSEVQREESILLPKQESIEVLRKTPGIPSRVADNLFWFSRYAERAENTTRIIRECINVILEYSDNPDPKAQADLLKILSFTTYTYPGFIGDDSSESINNPYSEIHKLFYDKSIPGSVAFSLNSLAQAAANVRDRLSDDTRKIIQNLEQLHSKQNRSYDQILEDIFNVIIHLTSLTGLSFENFSKEGGWFFLNIGRRIERILDLLRLLEGLLKSESFENKNLLSSYLNINDIRITYRRRYRYKLELPLVLDILLFDETNPRSLGYQINEIFNGIQFLPGKDTKQTFPEDRVALTLYTTYRMKDMSFFMQEGKTKNQDILDWFLDIFNKTKQLSQTITERYFNYAEKQISLN